MPSPVESDPREEILRNHDPVAKEREVRELMQNIAGFPLPLGTSQFGVETFVIPKNQVKGYYDRLVATFGPKLQYGSGLYKGYPADVGPIKQTIRSFYSKEVEIEDAHHILVVDRDLNRTFNLYFDFSDGEAKLVSYPWRRDD